MARGGMFNISVNDCMNKGAFNARSLEPGAYIGIGLKTGRPNDLKGRDTQRKALFSVEVYEKSRMAEG
jgi:hypothetical protein